MEVDAEFPEDLVEILLEEDEEPCVEPIAEGQSQLNRQAQPVMSDASLEPVVVTGEDDHEKSQGDTGRLETLAASTSAVSSSKHEEEQENSELICYSTGAE